MEYGKINMWNKYRIIKRKLMNESEMYVIQVEGYSGNGVLAGQGFIGGLAQHQGNVWTDVSSYGNLDAARQARRTLETGLKFGEEFIE